MESNYSNENIYLKALEALKGRTETISGVINNRFLEGDEDFEWEPLSIDTQSLTQITLGFGGPSDFLLVRHIGIEILRIGYFYSHWSDKAEFNIDETSPIWLYCEQLLEAMQ